MNRIITLFVIIALSAVSAMAQSSGLLTGRVVDRATQLALSGVRVSVVGTALETYTTSNGRYTLPAVAEGAQSVSFDYVGYDALTRAVDVDGTTRLDVQFGSDVVEMDAFVIEGALVGTARAINQQRASASLTNIVASDEIGSFADQNAAEALQRIPGISLYRDQGEGRYIVMCGMNFNYTSVKVNGGSFAGADLGDRATALDVVPTDALASIEVTKVPTPDMDGEGLGGRIDIKTKSPFDSEGTDAMFRAQGQYSALTGEWTPKVNARYSTRFGDEKQFGFMIAPTWQTREFGSHNFETGGDWTDEESTVNGSDTYFIEEIQFRDYLIERERYGVNVALEAKPSPSQHLYLHAGYNRFTDTEDRHRTVITFDDGDIDFLDGNQATITSAEDGGEYEKIFARELRMREKDQEVFSLVAGGSQQMGLWGIEGQVGFTKGKEERPDEIVAKFEPTDEFAKTFSYDHRSAYEVAVSQSAGPSILDAGSYEFDELEDANEVGEEESFDLSFDLRRDLQLTHPAYLKFGGLYRAKEKTSAAEIYESGDGPAYLQSLAGANAGINPDYPFLSVPMIDRETIQRAFYQDRGTFDRERNFEDSEYDDWSVDEDVTALYFMASGTFDKVNVIGGLRYEHTDFSTTGREVLFDDDGDPAGARNITESRSYENWLPGFFVRYDASDNLVFRASYSNALARPNFGDIAFRRLINDEDNEITVGNPFLETLEGTNWDASVEYYLPSLGVLSASVFFKEIENFAYEFETDADPRYAGYDVTSFANGSDGDIKGLELAYQQQLRMLPAPFDGLGFMANATFLDSDASYPTRPGEEVPFIGQSDLTANIAVTYDKGPFFVRLAMNHRDTHLREDEPIGDAVVEDFYIDDFSQLDLVIRYEIDDNWEVFAEWVNITDEPFRVYLPSDNGQGKRNGQIEYYDTSANLGFRWKM